MREGEKVKLPSFDKLMRLASKDQLKIFDNAAYRILSEMGVHIDDKDCIEYLKDSPVEIDEKELIVKFPEYWVREMIAKAPRSYTLAGRTPENDMSIVGPNKDYYILFSSGATKQYKWSESKNQWVSSVPGFNDVYETVKMIDAIDAYEGLFGSPVEDVVATQQGLPAELHATYAKFKGTSKFAGPIAITEGGIKEWDYLAKMAAEVQGGFDELTKRPVIAGLPTCIGPLTSTRQNFWAAIGSAKYHLPTFPYWGGATPFTAPATPAAQIALALACTHYGIAVSQYLDPGTAANPWPCCTQTAPETGQLINNPTFPFVNGIGIQIYQDLYGLASTGCCYCLTSSLEEAAAAWFDRLLTLTYMGSNIIQFGSTPQAFIWETIPLGETLINWTKQALFILQNGVLPNNEEYLALDTILEVGPKGRFATNPHTLNWIDPKKGIFWYSKDWIHEHSDQWLAKGAKRWAYDLCRERLKELAKHEPEPLAKDVEERIEVLLKEADEELALF
ncbi:MAG: trimethylamine methyltransferase family protein [Candidatus Lokiarchaeota archaeon]|nr:trimethylamine methyltransferase family protein [Candidatus Lokiarchaeota archaeon]